MKRRKSTRVGKPKPDGSAAEMRRERDEARAEQAATLEVLHLIASAPADLQTTFRILLDHATLLKQPFHDLNGHFELKETAPEVLNINVAVPYFGGELSGPIRLEFYTPEELTRIVRRSAGLLNAPLDGDGAAEIAKRSRGTPRIANRLLRRVRDYADVKADGRIVKAIADQALAMLDVDPQGFDVMDRKLLEAVIHRFDGGPVGLDNVAAAIGEERDTIEDVIEPFLIQQGFLQRTPRGRMVTLTTYRHFGITAPAASRDLLSDS